MESKKEPYTRKELLEQYHTLASRRDDRQIALELFLDRRFPVEHFQFWCGFVEGLTTSPA